MAGKIIVDVLLIVSGIYFMYAAFYLKKGFLEKIMALPEKTQIPSKENLDRFIKRMFPITIILGIWGTVTGILNLIDDLSGVLKGIPYFLVVGYLLLIVTYGYFSTHARNKFLVKESI